MAGSIEEVKKQYAAELLSRPGVVSVGIGLHEGTKVIIVGLDGKHPETAQQLPKQLEGYPLQVHTLGEIKAQ
ncbi:MAG: hypothetical protein OEZ39_04490 [Gammaproteobacteria bacterium]|nr:hypothetical protein [Gammaproteobacteria bacterium]MDH5651117.1 hypothetical protein [Gammaproteobacteria bacterium]